VEERPFEGRVEADKKIGLFSPCGSLRVAGGPNAAVLTGAQYVENALDFIPSELRSTT
jgi:hypothetical protein